MEYNAKFKTNLTKNDIEWSQTRIIFVARNFSKYQIASLGFKNLPFEIWKYALYENNLLSLNQTNVINKNADFDFVSNEEFAKVSKEIKVWTFDDHIKTKEGKELFEEFSQRVLALDSRINIRPVKPYISFNIDNKNFLEVNVRANKLCAGLLKV